MVLDFCILCFYLFLILSCFFFFVVSPSLIRYRPCLISFGTWLICNYSEVDCVNCWPHRPCWPRLLPIDSLYVFRFSS